MASETLLNDVVLLPFLMAHDFADTQHQLALLFSEYVEPRIRAVISVRLSSSTMSHTLADVEDLCSEVRVRLTAYLRELKVNLMAAPCRDFRCYIATAAHNACHDHFRQLYPERTRINKNVRYLLRTNSDFALWRIADNGKGEWICGFDVWRGKEPSADFSRLVHRFYDDRQGLAEVFPPYDSTQHVEMSQTISSVFRKTGEPIRVSDLVNIIAEITGIKEGPLPSLDGLGVDWPIADPKLRIDLLLELREPLARVWRALRQLPRDEFKAYLFYARDSYGDDLINLFLDADIATSDEIAALLQMTPREFVELRANRLPLDNEAISRELGVSVDRVYKLRHWAGRRLKAVLAEASSEKRSRRRKKSPKRPSHDSVG